MINRADDLVPMVMLSLKGCPKETAMYGIRRAISTVCRETNCWRGSISFVVSGLVETPHNVSVKIPDSAMTVDASISRIVGMLIEKSDGDDGFEESKVVSIGGYSMDRGDDNTLVFQNWVDVENGDRLTLDVVFYPPEIGTTLTDIPIGVLHQCAESAVHLATAILAGTPGRTWSDAGHSQLEMFEYRKAKRLLMFEIGQGNVDAFAESRMIGLVEG